MCLRGSSMTLTSSLEQWPPTVTAAVWKALEDRSKMGNKRNVPSEEATRVGCTVQQDREHVLAMCILWANTYLLTSIPPLAAAWGTLLAFSWLDILHEYPALNTMRNVRCGVLFLQDAAVRVAEEQHRRLLAALARGMTLEEEAVHLAQLQAAAASRGQQQQQEGQLTHSNALAGAARTPQQAAAGGDNAPARTAAGPRRLAAEFITEEESLRDIFDDRDDDIIIDGDDSDYSASGQHDGSSSGDLDGLAGTDDGGSGSDGEYHGSSRRRRSQRRSARARRQERRRGAAAAAAGGGSHNLRPRRRRGDSSQPDEGEQEGITTRSRRHT